MQLSVSVAIYWLGSKPSRHQFLQCSQPWKPRHILHLIGEYYLTLWGRHSSTSLCFLPAVHFFHWMLRVHFSCSSCTPGYLVWNVILQQHIRYIFFKEVLSVVFADVNWISNFSMPFDTFYPCNDTRQVSPWFRNIYIKCKRAVKRWLFFLHVNSNYVSQTLLLPIQFVPRISIKQQNIMNIKFMTIYLTMSQRFNVNKSIFSSFTISPYFVKFIFPDL